MNIKSTLSILIHPLDLQVVPLHHQALVILDGSVFLLQHTPKPYSCYRRVSHHNSNKAGHRANALCRLRDRNLTVHCLLRAHALDLSTVFLCNLSRRQAVYKTIQLYQPVRNEQTTRQMTQILKVRGPGQSLLCFSVEVTGLCLQIHRVRRVPATELTPPCVAYRQLSNSNIRQVSLMGIPQTWLQWL
jgi:hypothetical protein